MAYNQQAALSVFTGTATAFTSPLNAFNGSKIALNTVTTGNTTSTAGLVITVGGPQWNIEWDTLCAMVETNVTTTSLVVVPKWQVSGDGTNWVDLLGKNCAANVQKPATGTGSLVTTQYVMAFDGLNPGMRFIRAAVISTGATGAAGDNVTISYFFRRRGAGTGH